MKNLGTNQLNGITFDGQPLDNKSGLPSGSPHLFTAPSKESIHIAILAKALDGEQLANLIYTEEEALNILNQKIAAFEQFD